MEIILIFSEDGKRDFDANIPKEYVDKWNWAEIEILKKLDTEGLIATVYDSGGYLEEFHYQREENPIWIRRYGKFKTKEAATKFYYDRLKINIPAFNAIHGVVHRTRTLVEMNIIDEADTITKVLASCQQGVCSKRPNGECTIGAESHDCFDPSIFDPRIQISSRKIHHIPISEIGKFKKSGG